MRLRRNNSVVADAFCVLWLWILANRAASNEPPSERPQSDDPRQASVPMTGPQVSKGSGPVWPQLGGKAADPRMHRANTRPIPSRPCSCVSGGVGLTATFKTAHYREGRRHMGSRSGSRRSAERNTPRGGKVATLDTKT